MYILDKQDGNTTIEGPRKAYMSFEYTHSWFTQYPKGRFEISLKTFIAENAEGKKIEDNNYIVQIAFKDQKPKTIEQQQNNLSSEHFFTSDIMDEVTVMVKKNQKYLKQTIASKKILIATLIGNVVDTAESEINHRFKLTDDGQKEILFYLSLGSKYIPDNLDDL